MGRDQIEPTGHDDQFFGERAGAGDRTTGAEPIGEEIDVFGAMEVKRHRPSGNDGRWRL
jgi:hypothetical protein